MSGGRIIVPNADPVFQSPGVPISGATLAIYLTGTGTLANIFADIALSTAITNPQISNASGLFYAQSTSIFADATVAYDAVLTLPNGTSYTYVTLWPVGQPVSTSGFLQNPNPVLTGIPTAPTPAVSDNSSAIATTAFVVAYANTISVQPPGSIWFFAMTSAPAGWLACDGSLISRTVYARLFAQISTTVGAGDGSTTFGLPDLGGYFVRGWTSGQTEDSGRTFGSTQANAVATHQHLSPFILNDSITAPFGATSATHTVPGFTVAGSGSMPYWYTNDGSAVGSDNPNANTTVTTETRPDNVAMLACIKF